MKLVVIFMLFCTATASAQHIEFPLDTQSITVDGVLQPSEWQNAETVMIGVNTVDDIQVMYKHTGQAMCFAFSGKLESANALFPEVLTDAANAGGNSWINGQWWFHVSATDCEHNGAYGVYDNCNAVQPGWAGAPNFLPGAPFTDTVEIVIPFTKTGFNPATMDTMGIAFVATNTSNAFHLYPTTADKNQPMTWAKATFSKTPAAVKQPPANEKVISVHPNPANSNFTVRLPKPVNEVVIALFSITGTQVYSRKFTTGGMIYKNELPEIAEGLYNLSVETDNEIFNTQLSVSK